MNFGGEDSWRRSWPHKIVLVLIGSLFFALGFVAKVDVALGLEEHHFERTFRGTINEKWEIQLTLRSTEPISGSYFYERVKKPIRLEARVGEDQKWIVTEFDDKQMIAGQFVGDIFGRVFSGTWSNTDKSRNYPFYLIETYRQWRDEKSPYRPTGQLTAQAKKGSKDAQFHLAFLYQYGQGGFQYDMSEAVRWYKKAAAQGHIRAKFILGGLFLSGHGVKRNLNEALRLIGEAAESGDQEAKSWLTDWSKNAWMRTYYEKRQSTVDVQYAVDLIEADPLEAEFALKAIDSPAAKVYLAYLYYEGKAIVDNPSEVVNTLLREATNSSIRNYGEVKDTFYSTGHSTLFSYMRELASDVTVPCSIFIKYPHEAREEFQPHYGGCRDAFPAICGDAVITNSVPEMANFVKELSGTIRAECDIGTIRCAIGRGLAVTDSLWNMAPQMFLSDDAHCSGSCEEDATKLERLRFKARKGLERFLFDYFFFAKDNAKKLAHGYMQSKEKAQDVWSELYAECPEREK